MTLYLLDTNIVSAAVSDPEGRVAQRILYGPVEDIGVSIIVAAELRFGVERRGSSRITERVEQWLRIIPVMAMEEGVDHHYAKVRTVLERRGTPISGNDVLIAAHALALDATLVTDNLREFSRVDGLKVENWLRD